MILYDLNPGSGANTDNLIQIARGICCDEQGNICQDTLTLTALGTVVSVTVKDRNGVDVTTAVTGVTDKATLREALVKAYAAAGARVHGGGLKITQNGANYTITAMGEAQIVSLNNGSVRTFTHNCTEAWQCTNTFLVMPGADGTNNITVGGVTTSLGAIVYPTTTAASLETIVQGISGVGASSTVTADAVNRGYIAKVITDSKTGVFLNGQAPIEVNCVPVFTA